MKGSDTLFNIPFIILLSISIASMVGIILVPNLKNFGLVQHVGKGSPASHQKKTGTPSFGGFIFIIPTAIAMICINQNAINEGTLSLCSFILFALIGLFDDGLKSLRKNNDGLKWYYKMFLIVVVSGVVCYFINLFFNTGTSIIIPFLHKSINLGIWYLPFLVFFFSCTTNAANFADGIDGLAGFLGMIIMSYLAYLSFTLNHAELGIFCIAFISSIAGFLFFNFHPAKIFMGDTCSLAIGGAIATVAMILKLPLIILLVGIIYVAELISVVIQICYYKATKKRFFKRSPIHNHFVELGWGELKIVSLFSGITSLVCIFTIFLMPLIL